MKSFDFYEIVALICPGVILLLGIYCFCPHIVCIPENTKIFDISIGAAALQLIVALVLGHYVQFVGRQLERIFWIKRGMPTTWLKENGKLFSGSQYTDLVKYLGYDGFDFSKKIDNKALHSFVKNKIDDSNRQLYIFNSQYGMFRGLSCVWIILIILQLLEKYYYNHGSWMTIGLCVLLMIFSLVRMNNFGVYYARDLYSKYLIIAKKEFESKRIPA